MTPTASTERQAPPAAPPTDTAPPSPATLASGIAGIKANESRILDAWYRNQFAGPGVERYKLEDARQLQKDDALAHFLKPMLALLVAYLETGEERYRDVYLDERLRYAPHRADPKTRRAFFADVLPADEEAVIAAAGSAAAQKTIAQALSDIHAPLLETVGKDAIKLLAVGDCLLNEVRVFLRPRCAGKKIPLDMRCVYFSASTGRSLSAQEVEAAMAETRFDMFTFSFFTYEGLPPYTALLREADTLTAEQIAARVQALLVLVEDYLRGLRDQTEAPFIVHNVSGLPLTRYRRRLPFLPALSRKHQAVIDALNAGLRRIADDVPNVFLLDERDVAVKFGIRRAAESAVPRHLARGAYFHTSRFGEPLADAYAEILESFRDLRKAKVLLIDFDNTLWEGVMADGAVTHRLEAQKLLRTLKDAGMLLVALSKNDPKNIRWEEMHLTPEDFALFKISWNLKAQGVAEAANELDLGIDSFVLIDDSAQERELVTSQHPKVRALDPTKSGTWASLERLMRFPNTRATEESRQRTAMYRAQAERRRETSAGGTEMDYPAMMASLGLRVKFGKATAKELDRLTELVQRTNQFNTTTIRYTKTELAALISSPAHGVYAAEVTDKFGSFGLVAIMILSRAAEEVTLDSFVMSCRAMGFGLEQAFLRLVLDEEKQARRVIGRFLPTDRNQPSARVYADNGFRAMEDTLWLLDGDSARPIVPAWIAVDAR